MSMEQQIKTMENSAEWLDEHKLIIQVTFKGAWNWPEILQLVEDVRTLSREVDHEFHMIFDLSETYGVLGSGMLFHTRQIFDNPIRNYSNHLGAVGVSTEFRTAEALLRRALSRFMQNVSIYYAKTNAEAAEILRQIR